VIARGVWFMRRLLDHLLDEWAEQSECSGTTPGELCAETMPLADMCPHCKVRTHLLAAYHITGAMLAGKPSGLINAILIDRQAAAQKGGGR